MKKIVALMLVLVMALSVCACAGVETNGDNTGDNKQSEVIKDSNNDGQVNAVRNHKGKLPALRPNIEYLILHIHAGECVKRAQRLVQQQYGRPGHQSSGQSDPLLLAAEGESPMATLELNHLTKRVAHDVRQYDDKMPDKDPQRPGNASYLTVYL